MFHGLINLHIDTYWYICDVNDIINPLIDYCRIRLQAKENTFFYIMYRLRPENVSVCREDERSLCCLDKLKVSSEELFHESGVNKNQKSGHGKNAWAKLQQLKVKSQNYILEYLESVAPPLRGKVKLTNTA